MELRLTEYKKLLAKSVRLLARLTFSVIAEIYWVKQLFIID